jgi:hypothetical protein
MTAANGGESFSWIKELQKYNLWLSSGKENMIRFHLARKASSGRSRMSLGTIEVWFCTVNTRKTRNLTGFGIAPGTQIMPVI